MRLAALLRSIRHAWRRTRAGLSAAEWTRLEQVVGVALERPASERAAYLAEACADDPRLRAEAAALIDAAGGSGPIDRPVDEILAGLLASSDHANAPHAGALSVAHYELLERLPGGGMGLIYRARDRRLHRIVALKFLPMALAGDDRAKARFLLEARAAAALDHRNVCAIHEIGQTDDGQPYIAMPYYEGETLADRIARGPLPLGEAVRITTQMLHGLAHAHARGIVHRDIKPANVMLTADGVVKILDFGIVKLGDVAVTRSGMLLGTLPYISPEQLAHSAVDRRTDIWSVGVVLYEMLSGRRPFDGRDAHAIQEAILFSQPEPLTLGRPDLPAEISHILAIALAKHPDDRQPDAASFAASLEALGGELLAAGAVPDRASGETHSPEGERLSFRRSPDVYPGGERRPATIVVSAISGFDELVERCASTEVEALMRRLKQRTWEIASRHGGTINEFSEDRIVLLFGVPASFEDHCARAVHAALELHAVVREWETTRAGARDLALRTAIDTGGTAVQRMEGARTPYRVAGRAVSRASLLAAHARRDEILISPDAAHTVSAAFELEPAPRVELPETMGAVTPRRVLRATPAGDQLEKMAGRGELTRFAGRQQELETLNQCLRDLRDARGCVVTITGEAGVGKSRLLREFQRTIDPTSASVLTGRCSPYGLATGYLPFVNALRQVLEIDPGARATWNDADLAARVTRVDAGLIQWLPYYLRLFSLPSETYRIPGPIADEPLRRTLQQAVAELLLAAAARKPIVLLLEDWQWADSASHATLERLCDLISGRPLMIGVTSRPVDTLDSLPSTSRVSIELSPLDPGATGAMLAHILRTEAVPPELRAKIYDRTGGNPFFVEEVARSLIESNVVRVEDGHVLVGGELDAVHLPANVQAVLRARLDRLGLDARQVLRAASVIGRDFTRVLLERATAPAQVQPALETLVAVGLIYQTGWAPDEYRFCHALAQDVAYAGLLEHQRADLHARVGEAILELYQNDLDEWLNRLALHFSLAEQWTVAVSFALRSAERLVELGQFADALRLLDRAGPWVAMLPDDQHEEQSLELLSRQERLCDVLGYRERQRASADALVARLEASGDRLRLADAYLRKGDLHTLLHEYSEAEAALRRSLDLYRVSAVRGGERSTLRSLGFLRWHQRRYDEASAHVGEALQISRDEHNAAAIIGDLLNLGAAYRSAGDLERARVCLEEAVNIPEAVAAPEGSEVWWARLHALHPYGRLLTEIGDLDGALQCLTGPVVWERARRYRLAVQVSYFCTAIAQVYLKKGAIDQALHYYHEAVDVARNGRYQTGLAASLRLLGEFLLGIGRSREAIGHLREAAEVLRTLKDVPGEALVWLRVGSAEQRLGRLEESRAAFDTSRALRRGVGDRRGELEALTALAVVVRQCQPAAVALRTYQEAIHLAASLGDDRTEASLQNATGIIEWSRSRYGDALEHFDRALALYTRLSDPAGVGLMLNSCGVTLAALRRTDEARARLERALAHNVESDQPQLESHSLAALGDLSWDAGDVGQAVKWYEQSLRIRERIHDVRGEGWMLQRLARARAAAGKRAEADELLARASDLSVRSCDDELMAACAQCRSQYIEAG